MKKIVIGTLAAGAALVASPAAAQILSGTINVSGTISPRCQVVPPGQGDGTTFMSTVDLGDISEADGTLLPTATLAALFDGGGNAGADLQFKVVCNTATPQVSVDSAPILNAAAAPAGYANRVDYTGTVTFDTISGPDAFNNASTSAGTTDRALIGRLATGMTNVTITASNFATPNATDVIVAGAYAGLITITVAPN